MNRTRMFPRIQISLFVRTAIICISHLKFHVKYAIPIWNLRNKVSVSLVQTIFYVDEGGSIMVIKKNGLSRRDLLKGMAIGTGAIALSGVRP